MADARLRVAEVNVDRSLGGLGSAGVLPGSFFVRAPWDITLLGPESLDAQQHLPLLPFDLLIEEDITSDLIKRLN